MHASISRVFKVVAVVVIGLDLIRATTTPPAQKATTSKPSTVAHDTESAATTKTPLTVTTQFDEMIPTTPSTTPTPMKSRGNILALSMPGYSRWLCMLNIALELKELGYSTTFVYPDDPKTKKIQQEFGVDVVISDGMTKFLDYMDKNVVNKTLKDSESPFVHMFHFVKFCTYVAGDTALLRTLKHRQFDMSIIDTVLVNPCISVIPYKLSIPVVEYGAHYQVHRMRGIIHPSVYPLVKVFPLTDRMSYCERIGNTLLYLAALLLPDMCNPLDIVGTYAPEKPHLTNEELNAKTELYLLEHDELLDYHLPTYPNMVYVGGTATRPAMPLTGDLKSFLNSAKSGVILVTFGSIINILPEYLMINIKKATEIKRDLSFVIQCYNCETKIVNNTMEMPWIPQNDVLGHASTKLFISHCGNNAQYEALYHSVPIICLPIFGDQHYNALRIHRKGLGPFLNMAEFTAENLVSTIDELLRNNTFQQAISKASQIFKSRPLTPSQRAAWWIDHVIKYGGHHLRPAVADLPYYQFLMLDILAGVVVLVGLTAMLCCLLCKFVRRCFSRKLKPKQD